MKTERTALLVSETPNYAFESSITRRRKQQVRTFQICFCSALIFILIIALIISTTLTLNSLPNNSTNTNESIPVDIFFTLTGIIKCNFSKEYFPNETDYIKAVNETLKDLEFLKMIEKHQPVLEMNSPSYKHQIISGGSNKSKELSFMGYMEEFATKNFLQKTGKVVNLCIKENPLKNCSEYLKYRSYNGSCNNLISPLSGSALTPFRRVLPPKYSDGIGSPRSGINNSLPSPRTVSNVVHRPYFRNDPKFTVMLAVFGQFLDHDITSTAPTKGENLTTISCCDQTDFIHPDCFPVIIGPEDPYYSNYNITCMNFVRSAPAKTYCLGPREQMNQVSSYIDGSVIYGSNEETCLKLRTLENGLLKVLITPDNRTLLPISDDLRDGCNRDEMIKEGKYCFMSGDSRANENVHLTTMHLIWTRHHNNLAKRMHSINPHWSDERIFQETRKILIAQLQHIAYGEFLRIILGNKLLKKFELAPRRRDYYKNYNSSIDATISNNFATASFRFGHSLIPTLVSLIDNDKSSIEYLKLHEILFDPFLLYKPGGLDKVLKGAVGSNVQAHDTFFTPELKEHLFENKNSKICGLDLVSLNIQRGRDHGLPGYVDFREVCGLSKPKNFEEVEDIDQEALNYIRSIYRNVEDIDLYTGGLSETPKNGSMLGPTLNCLIIDQFARLKRGDRHWYENPGEFTEVQLREIRKSSLGKILCENSDGVKKIQPFAMENIGRDNVEEPCEDLPSTDLKYWKENVARVYVPNRDMAIGENIWHSTG